MAALGCEKVNQLKEIHNWGFQGRLLLDLLNPQGGFGQGLLSRNIS